MTEVVVVVISDVDIARRAATVAKGKLEKQHLFKPKSLGHVDLRKRFIYFFKGPDISSRSYNFCSKDIIRKSLRLFSFYLEIYSPSCHSKLLTFFLLRNTKGETLMIVLVLATFSHIMKGNSDLCC